MKLQLNLIKKFFVLIFFYLYENHASLELEIVLKKMKNKKIIIENMKMKNEDTQRVEIVKKKAFIISTSKVFFQFEYVEMK